MSVSKNGHQCERAVPFVIQLSKPENQKKTSLQPVSLTISKQNVQTINVNGKVFTVFSKSIEEFASINKEKAFSRKILIKLLKLMMILKFRR